MTLHLPQTDSITGPLKRDPTRFERLRREPGWSREDTVPPRAVRRGLPFAEETIAGGARLPRRAKLLPAAPAACAIPAFRGGGPGGTCPRYNRHVDLDYQERSKVPLHQRRNLRRLALLILSAAILVLLVLSFPQVIYRRIDEIDIRSGRVRSTRYVLFLRTGSSVVETPLSRALPAEPEGTPDWQLVNTFDGWSGVSPHHAYHGAINQTQHVALLWQLVPFDAEAKQMVAANVLKRWQADGGYWGADRYLIAVDEAASEHFIGGQGPVSADQVPDAVPAPSGGVVGK